MSGMDDTAVLTAPRVKETAESAPTAHLYCYLCCPPPIRVGNVAFCGHVSTGTSNPNGDRCVVCIEFENSPCPTCAYNWSPDG